MPVTSQRYNVFLTADSIKVTIPGLSRMTSAFSVGRKLRFCSLEGFARTVVVITKYNTPAPAAQRSHASRIAACVFTDGVYDPTWKVEISNRSKTILIKNFTPLITSGTSGLSSALVALATAVSIAELNATKALNRT